MAKLEAHVSQAAPETTSVTEEFEQEWFDLLPIEKKLIGYSLGLGVLLLGIFILVFRVLPSM
ncbi:MAG TPA: hypothetical protein GX504_00980 [Clostridia bacterium]|nr:hypothetical protein [Clostridia bacterium]